jgi:hypothetical protein
MEKSPKRMRQGDGRDRARLKGGVEVKQRVSPRLETFYTFTIRSLRVGSGLSGKPGVSGLNPGYSAPPEPNEQIFKEFDFQVLYLKIQIFQNKCNTSLFTNLLFLKVLY